MASASAPALEQGGWALPQFKGRPGWEFTDISALNLADYRPVTADEDVAPPADELWAFCAAALRP